jgi:hypothetical protein
VLTGGGPSIPAREALDVDGGLGGVDCDDIATFHRAAGLDQPLQDGAVRQVAPERGHQERAMSAHRRQRRLDHVTGRGDGGVFDMLA